MASLSGAAFVATLAVAPAGPPADRVDYRLGLDQPHRQYVHVRMRVGEPTDAHDDVAMPAWTPGSYLIRDFAKHVYDVRAAGPKGKRLDVERLDKQTWRVHHDAEPYEVRYRVFADERSVRTSHVDDHHASLLGTSVLMYVDGEPDRPTRLRVDLPRGWSAHSALHRIPSAPGRAVYLAPDYDELVDSPIELGDPQVRRFEVDGTRFSLVVTDADLTALDLDRLAADVERIVTTQGQMMGGFPMKRYVFLLDMAPHGGGGLEHAASTSMMMRRSAFDDESGYAAARRLVAHEFFHLWNVKRIHDVVLGPFAYGRENHTTLLWFHEGFTEAVESLSLLRAGFVTPKQFVDALATDYTRYAARPGSDHDPLAQLSHEAWTKAYQPENNHRNVSVSYYAKGKLVGVLLDVQLRRRSARHGKQGSLVGLLRRLMSSHGAAGRGITEADIIAAASDEAGEDMSDFFARYVRGTERLPLPDALAQIGIVASDRPVYERADGSDERDAKWRRIWTGMRLSDDGEVRDLEPGSPADEAGLMRGDELLAVGNRRADARDELRRLLGAIGPGGKAKVTFFRDGRMHRTTLSLGENPKRTWSFSLQPAAELSGQVRALRDDWLRHGRAPPTGATVRSKGKAAGAASSASPR